MGDGTFDEARPESDGRSSIKVTHGDVNNQRVNAVFRCLGAESPGAAKFAFLMVRFWPLFYVLFGIPGTIFIVLRDDPGPIDSASAWHHVTWAIGTTVGWWMAISGFIAWRRRLFYAEGPTAKALRQSTNFVVLALGVLAIGLHVAFMVQKWGRSQSEASALGLVMCTIGQLVLFFYFWAYFVTAANYTLENNLTDQWRMPRNILCITLSVCLMTWTIRFIVCVCMQDVGAMSGVSSWS
mmetsp:Transcript_117213/g.204096  ORF Transcript_117213/g.204096 Transcript_117213/m.204096 type:complete len:239 (-) Transcript_117213:129-845(-)